MLSKSKIITNMKNNSGMSPSRWAFIKNMLAIIVLFSHMVVKTDMGFLSCLYDAGTFAVAIFFFLSGYGVTFSVIHKPSYLKFFFRGRILYILIMYVLATIVYVSLCYVCGIDGDFVFWRIFSCYPILPYGWYFVVLLCLYVVFLASSIPPPILQREEW